MPPSTGSPTSRARTREARQDRFRAESLAQQKREQKAFDWHRLAKLRAPALRRADESCLRHQTSFNRSSPVYSARPARPPTTAPLKRMNCRSFPTLISISLTSCSRSQALT